MNGAILNYVDSLVRKSESEYAAPCPWCEGADRFIVWPHKGSGGSFWCRKCGQKGDCIDLLRAKGMSFAEARTVVEGESLSPAIPAIRRIRNNRSSQLSVDREKWTKAAWGFLEQIEGHGPAELSSLREMRHLRPDTAERLHIRWNVKDRLFDPQGWGFESDKKLLIPAGLVIPVFNNEKLIGLVIRCSERPKRPKYWQVKGSGNECMTLGEKGLPLIIVESHLDAFLIWQEASDLVSVVSVNGTKKPLDTHSLGLIESAPSLLVATDFDDPSGEGSGVGAGQGAFLHFKKQFPSAEYSPVPVGKDPGEMVTLGVSVRDWLRAVLPESKGSTLQLPPGYPGSASQVEKDLKQYPHLVPCPNAEWLWAWKRREYCKSCSGHIYCIKDWRPFGNVVPGI